MLISQFKKILIENFKKLILVCWSGILDYVNKYGIIMLINVMKSDELTITIVYSNPHCLHTKNPNQKSIVVAFKTLGSNSFQNGLNILLQKDATFCLPCFLFHRLFGNPRQNAFTVDGFRSWKKVRNGKRCDFLSPEGKDFNSSHRVAEKRMDDLMNQPQHIDKVLNKQCYTKIANNRLQLKVSIDVVRVLALQGIAFRDQDDSSTSVTCGNFLEILDVVTLYD